MKNILITAGATRNPIDSMRFISANSSGRTGAWLASELSRHASVTLLGSPEAISRCSFDGEKKEFSTTTDLLVKMQTWISQHPKGIVIHAAAVGDYQTRQSAPDQKVPSGQEQWHITLVPAPKILDLIHGWSPHITLVSFKAAPPDTSKQHIEAISESQAKRTQSHVVFANTIGRFNSDIFVWRKDASQWYDHRQSALDYLVKWVESQPV